MALNNTDKENMIELFLERLLEKADPSLKQYVQNNKEAVIDNMLEILKDKTLSPADLKDPVKVKDISAALMTSVTLTQPDPVTKKSLMDDLNAIFKKYGLIDKDNKPRPEKKLTPQERKELKKELDAWVKEFSNRLEKDGVLKPEEKHQFEQAMTKSSEQYENLLGLATSAATGSFAVVVSYVAYNYLQIPDQNPYHGMANIDRINDPADSAFTGGDYQGLNADTQRNYLQGGGLLDDLIQDFMEDLHDKGLDKAGPSFGSTKFTPPSGG